MLQKYWEYKKGLSIESNKIIIILLAIIVIILVAGIVILVNPFAQSTNISMISADQLYVGDSIAVCLTDSNNNPISNQKISINIGGNSFVATTNSNGEASVKLNNISPGSYNVNIVFQGDFKYSKSNITQNIEIRELESVEPVNEASTSSESADIREEDKVTADGWDPKLHEVRRKDFGEYEQVYYDDGYMRVVDKDGNIVSYGYA